MAILRRSAIYRAENVDAKERPDVIDQVSPAVRLVLLLMYLITEVPQHFGRLSLADEHANFPGLLEVLALGQAGHRRQEGDLTRPLPRGPAFAPRPQGRFAAAGSKTILHWRSRIRVRTTMPCRE